MLKNNGPTSSGFRSKTLCVIYLAHREHAQNGADQGKGIAP
jgi:hypothetical protein